MSILVSICCQAYNQKDFIEQCLNGFESQITSFDFEILVHDDASTDGTADILKKFEKVNPSLYRNTYQKTNQFRKLNSLTDILVKNARGKYIAFCEGDDYWTDPYKLQKQVDLLESNPDCVGCVAQFQDYFMDLEKFVTSVNTHKKSKLSFPQIVNSYFHTSTFLLKREELVYIISNYSALITGDTSYRLLLSERGPFCVLDDVVSVYRRSGDGFWTSLSQVERDKTHYRLFHDFRIKHIKSRRYYYLNREIDYLQKIVKVEKTMNNRLKLIYLFSYRKLLKLKSTISKMLSR